MVTTRSTSVRVGLSRTWPVRSAELSFFSTNFDTQLRIYLEKIFSQSLMLATGVALSGLILSRFSQYVLAEVFLQDAKLLDWLWTKPGFFFSKKRFKKKLNRKKKTVRFSSNQFSVLRSHEQNNNRFGQFTKKQSYYDGKSRFNGGFRKSIVTSKISPKVLKSFSSKRKLFRFFRRTFFRPRALRVSKLHSFFKVYKISSTKLRRLTRRVRKLRKRRYLRRKKRFWILKRMKFKKRKFFLRRCFGYVDLAHRLRKKYASSKKLQRRINTKDFWTSRQKFNYFRPMLARRRNLERVAERSRRRKLNKKANRRFRRRRNFFRRRRQKRRTFLYNVRFFPRFLRFSRFRFFRFFSRFYSSAIYRSIGIFIKFRLNFLSKSLNTSEFYLNYITTKLYYRYILMDVVKPIVRMSLRYYRGFRITCKGRFSRAQMATEKTFTRGSLRLSNVSVPVDYAQKFVVLKYGVCNLKIWIRY